ncbi:5-oxoprolinase subunit PxpA [Acinetobacter baumannii]|uniref:LamB/YcsF family protein n=1 Tax=Acinetobacter baumannii TaxID=470 RepID=UPI00280E71CB|nr:5-oxoprolinase subunit PxpA [Acinetobacter baumannii]MDQ8916752.1 5-oxoprolinase subunit PxpA [Acinetobacter baumannii]MDQ8947706.1 5-oxoprolinase subunit PxpA [Acinetobacter baumannii]MDQ8961874.1 5-oxoprolinase subunit PxpA [Acinetobacter baumannii]MDQ8965691.1 5-oxoprolinase subunit PxpA [Acinetobacter baumannii]MDQ8979697.1 5-oxoprolinase subunit PxpA [Acinetobacter baumannii]
MFVDLNSDLGESFGSWKMGNDDQILPVVTSANIACGFHAGDPLGILKTVRKAVELGVTIGAHVSYPDLVGFGRRNMDLSRDELIADVLYQISALDGLAKVAGSKVQYVKPHGALYNTIAHDQAQAAAVIDAIKMYNPELVLVALAGSNLVEQARAAGLRVVSEAFADRAYNSDGSLVSRRLEGAVLHDSGFVASRVVSMLKNGGVESIDGVFTPIQADTICLHGDTDGALEMSAAIKAELVKNNIEIRPFVNKA